MSTGNSIGLSNICKLKYHYVYKITNNINGKIYIGRHSTNNLNDCYFGSGKMLKRAVKKYGKENFHMDKVMDVDSFHKSVLIEALFVDRDFCNRKDTYNIVEGGYNPIMYGENNPSWKGGVSKIPYVRKGKRKFFGKDNYMYGRTHSDEAKEKIRRANIGRVPHNKGIKLSKEDREKHIPLQKTCKSVWVDNCSFLSIRDCARKLCVKQGVVQTRVASDNYPNWRYGEYDKSKTDHSKIKIVLGTSRAVIQMSKDGEYIAEYESIKKAGRELGLNDADIGDCCRGKIKTNNGYSHRVKSCGGFKWKFK